MNKKNKHISLCCLLAALWFPLLTLSAQTPDVKNQRDAQGRKQGYWEAVNREGQLVYSGFFKDDKPIGRIKRYYPLGELRVTLDYRPNSNVVTAHFFQKNGDTAAFGNYINGKRDSIWIFLNPYTKAVSYRIMYYRGQRNGKSLSYYPQGALNEELNWVNDRREGRWQQFYESGKPKVTGVFLNNELEGTYTVYYPDGQKETVGKYVKGVPEGEWTHFNLDGSVATKVIYSKGVVQNAEQISEETQEWFRKAMQAVGTIKEPDEADVMEAIQGR